MMLMLSLCFIALLFYQFSTCRHPSTICPTCPSKKSSPPLLTKIYIYIPFPISLFSAPFISPFSVAPPITILFYNSIKEAASREVSDDILEQANPLNIIISNSVLKIKLRINNTVFAYLHMHLSVHLSGLPQDRLLIFYKLSISSVFSDAKQMEMWYL